MSSLWVGVLLGGDVGTFCGVGPLVGEGRGTVCAWVECRSIGKQSAPSDNHFYSIYFEGDSICGVQNKSLWMRDEEKGLESNDCRGMYICHIDYRRCRS